MQLLPSANITILVVENDPLNPLNLVGLLDQLGHEFDRAADGQAALEAIATAHYDIILIDDPTPKSTGYDIALKIRQKEIQMPIPAVIIAVSAASSHDRRSRAFAAGVDDFLSRPVSLPCLQFTLNRWSYRRGLRPNPPLGLPGNGVDPWVAFRDHLDWSRLAAFSEQDEAFARSLIQLFLTDTWHKLRQLRIVVNHGDDAAVEQLAHSLKGASASIGAGVVWAIASNLEAQARQHQLWAADQQVDRMEASLQLIEQVMVNPVDANSGAQAALGGDTPPRSF